MKRLVISREELETRVALLEDERVTELYVERPASPSLVGNIYKGRVENVLAGMDAAFVNIGIGRNGFLCVDEVGPPGGRGRSGRKITSLLQSGEQVLVQVARDAMGSKGPRLTTQLGIVGRCLVYLPRTITTGVSRRLDDAERERLRGVCAELDPGPSGGVIVRTAAEGVDQRVMARELRFLRHQWGCVQSRAAACGAPTLVYKEADLAIRCVRDLLGAESGSVVVDDAGLQRRLVNYLRAIAPEHAAEVALDGGGDLFERCGLEGEIGKALARRVELHSGGYIVIDHTEAMTVIDVNTGSYTGRRFLEETTLKTNLEACGEVVRQLRLRDIGGIIVIDFIDMAVASNREAVLSALQAELAKDRTKSYVVALSPLGLVEMTRQNVTPGLREAVTAPCPECRGTGRVVSEETALIEVRRRIWRIARASVLPGIRVEVQPRMATKLVGTGTLDQIEAQTGRRVEVQKARRAVPPDHCEIVPD